MKLLRAKCLFIVLQNTAKRVLHDSNKEVKEIRMNETE